MYRQWTSYSSERIRCSSSGRCRHAYPGQYGLIILLPGLAGYYKRSPEVASAARLPAYGSYGACGGDACRVHIACTPF
ncbi:hypothetical protein EXIGLDRAFT_764949 [Exidia glandulosa HHB12029]|uniref:Uncharacterized protein n=1 Tax=Exidia glandulosa HHB12029 TaxID=1314781 RepID=A0A165KTY4_EXIGL|nr:hypothetical protein EXIGLDRAFT_764949 [Exidia glandulosa HHB12029]